MKKLNYFKLLLDLLMAVTFVLLFNTRVLGGLSFHEIAGLGIGIAFLTHILLNVQWIKRVTLKMLDRKLPWKTRFEYLLNLLLIFSMAFIIVSGIVISRVVFPNLNVSNEGWFKMAHISISFLVLAIVGVHVGLHWKWVMTVVKKMPGLASVPPRLTSIGLKAAMVAVLAFGVYQMYENNYVQRLTDVTSVFGSGTAQIEGGRGGFEGGKFEGARPSGDLGSGVKPKMAQGGFEDHDREGGGGASPLSVLSTYLGMMGVIVIVTYYLNKWGSRRKPNSKISAA